MTAIPAYAAPLPGISGWVWPVALLLSLAVHVGLLGIGWREDWTTEPVATRPMDDLDLAIAVGGELFAPAVPAESRPAEQVAPSRPPEADANSGITSTPLAPISPAATATAAVLPKSQGVVAVTPSATLPAVDMIAQPVSVPETVSVAAVQATATGAVPSSVVVSPPTPSTTEAPVDAVTAVDAAIPTGMDVPDANRPNAPDAGPAPDVSVTASATQSVVAIAALAAPAIAVAPPTSPQVVVGGGAGIASPQPAAPASPTMAVAEPAGPVAATSVTPLTSDTAVSPAQVGLVPSVAAKQPVSSGIKVSAVTPNTTVAATQSGPSPTVATVPPPGSGTSVVAALSAGDAITATEPIPADENSSTMEPVPAIELASTDPLAAMTEYVARFQAGPCTHLSVTAADENSAAVTGFGVSPAPFIRFDQIFRSDQGFDADIELRLVQPEQCAILDALGRDGAVDAAGSVRLDRTVVTSGGILAGAINRDLQVVGLATPSMGAPPELYLIDDEGQILDARDAVRPDTTPGAWRFGFPVTMVSASDEAPALVLVIWNRPLDTQPLRFDRKPGSQASDILMDAEVYSLVALKVVR